MKFPQIQRNSADSVCVSARFLMSARACFPAGDPPSMAGNPADPLHPPAQLLSDLAKPQCYSEVAKVNLKTLARPPDEPGSPGGWGAVDPTRAESDSDSDDEKYDDK